MDLDLNEFAKKVHANAVAHGFWGEEYTDATVIALIHAEISEAFEEWRAGRSMVWHECISAYDGSHSICENNECHNVNNVGVHEPATCAHRNPKPDGIAVELIDVVLRVLDAAAAWGYEIKPLENPEPIIDICGGQRKIEAIELPELVLYLHQTAAVLYIARANGRPAACIDYMSDTLAMVFTWLRAQNLDPEALMLEKHAYNKARPYRHGGKRV